MCWLPPSKQTELLSSDNPPQSYRWAFSEYHTVCRTRSRTHMGTCSFVQRTLVRPPSTLVLMSMDLCLWLVTMAWAGSPSRCAVSEPISGSGSATFAISPTVSFSVFEYSVSDDDFGSSSADGFHSSSLSESNGNGSPVLNPDLVVIVDVDSLTCHLYRA